MNYKQMACKIIICCVLVNFTSCNKTVKKEEIILENKDFEINKTIKSNTKDLDVKNNTITESSFYYNLSSRFQPIKKSEIIQAITIHSYLSPEESNDIDEVESVEIIKIINNQQSNIRVTNNNEYLSKNQITFLKGLDYSEHYKMNINYKTKNTGSGNLELNRFTLHHTIVPETQAVFSKGNSTFIDYLKTNNISFSKSLDLNTIRSTKFYFTITEKGSISNLRLDWSTGFKEIDQQLLDLISNTNGLWHPAKNIKGEFVTQELVVTFGLPGNC